MSNSVFSSNANAYRYGSTASVLPAGVSAGSVADQPIIGESAALQGTLRDIEVVGPTDSTVLILGESGTGKELVARRIHALSARRHEPFVEVNCAAIPLGLLESELFGHERGAFTGAVAQRIGRFEVANRGTLFLDEIGDIPLELQPKLLRVLQEQRFERLGSARTQHINVRVIAATHRNMTQMLAESKFRMDLYYRLNVFPINVAPLRDRRQDIPKLVRYFTDRFASRMKKRIPTIPAEVMETLVNHSWHGNVRELQNFIERSVIRSTGSVLEAPLLELAIMRDDVAVDPVTLKEAERAHIVRTLRECNGVIARAAARLDVPRSTLFYKMRRLGIGQPGMQARHTEPSPSQDTIRTYA